jgi:hypothetical protein
MELKDIKAKICDLRFSLEELADECFNIWKETNNPRTQEVAEFLQYELNCVTARLADLEETEDTDTDTEDDDADTIADWWTDLDLQTKCELSNIPYPTCNYGRGDEYFEAEERATHWWNSRTYEQKKEIYEETLAWWDKE